MLRTGVQWACRDRLYLSTWRLDVNGVALTKLAQSLAAAIIAFGLSNLATTSVNCQAMTLNNIKDGGTYSLVVTGATAATYSPAEHLAHFRIRPQS